MAGGQVKSGIQHLEKSFLQQFLRPVKSMIPSLFQNDLACRPQLPLKLKHWYMGGPTQHILSQVIWQDRSRRNVRGTVVFVCMDQVLPKNIGTT